MIGRLIRSAFGSRQISPLVQRYAFGSIKQFNQLELLNQYLTINHFPLVVVYFRAQWNPHCKLTDEHINQLANAYQQLEIIKVDSDVAPKIAKHYLVRAEPEFVFCLHGDEILRQTGPNKEGLLEKAQKIIELSGTSEQNEQKWVPFGTRFENYYKKAYGKKPTPTS